MIKRKRLLAATALSVWFSSIVFADPVNINITGKVIAAPCTVDSSNVSVDLGQNILASTLNPANSYSDWKTFNVTLSKCPAGTSTVTATLTGNVDGNDNSMYANATGDGYSENVAVELQRVTGSANAGNGKTLTVDVDNARNATFDLRARAYSTPGGTTVGNISTVVMMNFTYN